MEINFADQESLIATQQIYMPQKFGAISYSQAPLTRDNECVWWWPWYEVLLTPWCRRAIANGAAS